MINSLKTYYNCGKSSGQAVTHGDWALANFQRSWVDRAKYLEQPADRKLANEAFLKGYTEGRGRIGK